MNSNEVSSLTGVSVRTLHHYDAIGLLCPMRNSDNSYRDYSGEDIDKLQQILFFKECGFSLAKIKEILSDADFDRKSAFEMQKKMLLQERERLDVMLHTLEKSLLNMRGEIVMSQEEKFEGFDFTENSFKEEAARLWGKETVEKSNDYIEPRAQDVKKKMDKLFIELAGLKDERPDTPVAQQAMEKMYQFFNTELGIPYSLETFAGVGQMYVADERFTANIDKFGAGLSRFLSEAMTYYAENKQRNI